MPEFMEYHKAKVRTLQDSDIAALNSLQGGLGDREVKVEHDLFATWDVPFRSQADDEEWSWQNQKNVAAFLSNAMMKSDRYVGDTVDGYPNRLTIVTVWQENFPGSRAPHKEYCLVRMVPGFEEDAYLKGEGAFIAQKLYEEYRDEYRQLDI